MLVFLDVFRIPLAAVFAIAGASQGKFPTAANARAVAISSAAEDERPAPSGTSPASTTQLSAMTSGSTNQPLRHWWAVKATPAGAKLVFDHQGSTNTAVRNLLLPGSYTFTLRAFDDIHAKPYESW